MNQLDCLITARKYIAEGLVLAYPTEAVYGLGCDPFNEKAVFKILNIKGRNPDKGLILLISDFSQLYPLILPIADNLMEKVKSTWPGPTTWVFPKSEIVPSWISGKNETVAIRMTAHSIARSLCKDRPIVSTSANMQNELPLTDLKKLQLQFGQSIDGVVLGNLGDSLKPSVIYDVLDGKKLR